MIKGAGGDEFIIPSGGIKLNLDQGTSFTIHIEGHEEPLKGMLVGHDANEYLIVRIPSLDNASGSLKPGTMFQVGYVSLGNYFQFTSNLVGAIDSPFPLIFLSYPDSIKNVDDRRNSRVGCYIPATMKLPDRQMKGAVTDISQKGCRFVIKLPASLQTRQVRLIDDIELHFPLIGLNELICFKGQVRNTTVDRSRIAMGVEFIDLEARIVTCIEEYIKNIAMINECE